MQIEFYFVMAILVSGLIIYGIYDIKKKSEIKLEEIKLEREKISLTTKKAGDE